MYKSILDMKGMAIWTSSQKLDPRGSCKAWSQPLHCRQICGYDSFHTSTNILSFISPCYACLSMLPGLQRKPHKGRTALSHGLVRRVGPCGNSKCRHMGRGTEINTAWSKASSTRLSGWRASLLTMTQAQHGWLAANTITDYKERAFLEYPSLT